MYIDNKELDARILVKNIEITKLTEQIDSYKTDNVSRKEEIDIHLDTVKNTLDYLHTTKLKYTLGSTEKLDGIINNLIKTVKYLKK